MNILVYLIECCQFGHFKIEKTALKMIRQKFSRERADERTLITSLKRVKERKIAFLNISKHFFFLLFLHAILSLSCLSYIDSEVVKYGKYYCNSLEFVSVCLYPYCKPSRVCPILNPMCIQTKPSGVLVGDDNQNIHQLLHRLAFEQTITNLQ
jgi:hypothetical protein